MTARRGVAEPVAPSFSMRSGRLPAIGPDFPLSLRLNALAVDDGTIYAMAPADFGGSRSFSQAWRYGVSKTWRIVVMLACVVTLVAVAAPLALAGSRHHSHAVRRADARKDARDLAGDRSDQAGDHSDARRDAADRQQDVTNPPSAAEESREAADEQSEATDQRAEVSNEQTEGTDEQSEAATDQSAGDDAQEQADDNQTATDQQQLGHDDQNEQGDDSELAGSGGGD
jgi:hypothetical protein